MRRGELWTVAGGVYASKPRPALIVQDDLFEGTASVTVAPLTTTLVDAPLLRVRVAADDLTGLQHDSQVMIDKVTTVRRKRRATSGKGGCLPRGRPTPVVLVVNVVSTGWVKRSAGRGLHNDALLTQPAP